MAFELQIRDSEDRVKIRSPWAAALLPIITLGIYHLVWWYRVNKELADFGRARGYDLGQNPTMSLLAVFPGALIIVPALVSYWRGTQRMQAAARVAGQEPPNGWIALILFLSSRSAYGRTCRSRSTRSGVPRRRPSPGSRPRRRSRTACRRGWSLSQRPARRRRRLPRPRGAPHPRGSGPGEEPAPG
jgi:hypothetical protein